MHSIQARLIATIAASSLLLSAASGTLLYLSIRADLVRQFDRSLEVKAAAITSLVQWQPNGRIDFEYSENAMPEFQHAEHAEYFIIRFENGKVFARSKTLKGSNLPTIPNGATARDALLPSGHAGRAVKLDFVPVRDPDGNSQTFVSGFAPPTMSITVARSRVSLDGALNRLLRTFVFGTVLLASTATWAVVLIVRRALRPLRMVADHTARIDSMRLDLRLPDAQLPAELKPITARLNELMERLEGAFKRERRFTADVAHELRTPIAELRCVAEVALMRPEDSEAAPQALGTVVEIAEQMEELVCSLLSLLRNPDKQPINAQPIELRPLLLALIENCQRTRPRNVSVNVPATALAMGDLTLLSSVLTNILNNAFEYSPTDSAITCDARQIDGHWLLAIENITTNLTEGDLPHLQEPFWRKDDARTEGGHPGLGLSLVATFCMLMNIGLLIELPHPHLFRITLSFSGATHSADSVGASKVRGSRENLAVVSAER